MSTKKRIKNLELKIKELKATIEYDNNIIFKYLTEGIELHPSYCLERLVVSDYKEIKNNPNLPIWYYEHFNRYDFAKELIKKDDNVLDIACGTGYGSHLIAEETEAQQVLGVDISETAINFCKKMCKNSNLSFNVGNALDNQFFSASSFNKIISFETLEHVRESDLKIMLKNYYKWLKKGGTFIGSTPNEEGRPLYQNGKHTNIHHFKHYTKEEIEKILLDCGFLNIEIIYQNNAIISSKNKRNDSDYFVVIAKK